jgi:hypothetical protein
MKDWHRLADTLQGMLSGFSIGFVLGMFYCRRKWVGHYRRIMDGCIEASTRQTEALECLCTRIGEEIEQREQEGRTDDCPH